MSYRSLWLYILFIPIPPNPFFIKGESGLIEGYQIEMEESIWGLTLNSGGKRRLLMKPEEIREPEGEGRDIGDQYERNDKS